MFNNYIFRIGLIVFTLNWIAFNSNAQSIEVSISKGLNNSNSLSASSLEWASLREKLNQSSAGKEITGTLKGSFSETYSGSDGDYNNSFSNSITATLSKKLYDGGVAKSSEGINSLKIDQKSIQIKVLEQKVILKLLIRT
jgi:outer membrane protein TolC